MLENCQTLIRCEDFLMREVEKVTFIGQIPLIIKDVEHLGLLIRNRVQEDVAGGTESLRNLTPVSFACFLVGCGVWFYHSGEYWPSVAKLTGINDTNWLNKWGRIFIDFLASRGMPVLEIPEAYTYVANILLHAGVPQRCLPDFFRAMFSLAGNGMQAKDESVSYLRMVREQEKSRKHLGIEREKLQREEQQIAQVISRLDLVSSLVDRAKTSLQRMGNLEETDGLPSDYHELSLSKQAENELKQRIAELSGQRANIIQQVHGCTLNDRILLSLQGDIQKASSEIKALADKRRDIKKLILDEENCYSRLEEAAAKVWYGLIYSVNAWALDQLDWDELIECASFYEDLKQRHKKVLQEWELIQPPGIGYKLQAHRIQAVELHGDAKIELEQQMATVRLKLASLLGGIPIPEQDLSLMIDRFTTETAYTLKEIQRSFHLLDEIRQSRYRAEVDIVCQETRLTMLAGFLLDEAPKDITEALPRLAEKLAVAEKKHEASSAAKAKLKDITRILDELEKIHEEKNKELSCIEKRLMQLGSGDVQLGIKEVSERRQASKDFQAACSEIESVAESLGLALPWPFHLELVQEYKEKQEVLLRTVRKKLSANEDAFRHCNLRLPIMDEPVERFLLYGGQWSEEWLGEAIELANWYSKNGNIPLEYTTFPFRVVQELMMYLDKNKKGGEEPRTGVGDPTRSSTERFPEPVMRLNSKTGEVSISVDAQRFYIKELREPYLRISAEGQNEQTLPLAAYWCGKDLVETEPTEWLLSYNARKFQVMLTLGDTMIMVWDIPGVTLTEPYMVFDEKGQRVQSMGSKRARAWFLLPPGFAFEPPVQVVEEMWWEQVDPGYRLCLVDLRYWEGDGLFLVTHEGRRIPLIKPEHKLSEPTLWGGNKVSNVRVGEDVVFSKIPPFLRIPLNGAKLEDWQIAVIPRKGNSAERKWHSLDDVADIATVWPGANTFDIPLDSQALLGSRPFGRYSIWIWNKQKRLKFYRFNLTVLPDIEINWDPTVCLPSSNPAPLSLEVMIFTEDTIFSVEEPSLVLSVDEGTYEVMVPPQEREVIGCLVCGPEVGARSVIQIQLPVPKLYWRIDGQAEGRDWNDRVEELWLGDWAGQDRLVLEVKVPEWLDGQMILATEDQTKRLMETLRNGIAKFDILAFHDTLRQGEVMRTLGVTIKDKKDKIIQQGPLVNVRTRWLVENIKWSCERGEKGIILHIGWMEKGKAANRCLCLWPIGNPGLNPFTYSVPDGETSLTIDGGNSLIPGRYQMQLVTTDPWTGDVGEAALLTEAIVIDVDDGSPHIQGLSFSWTKGDRLEVQGTVANTRRAANVTVVVYGLVKSRTLMVASKTMTGTEGRFSTTVTISRPSEDGLTQKFIYWLGIFTDNHAYEIIALKRSNPLVLLLTQALLEDLASLPELPDVMLLIRPRGGFLGHPGLDAATTRDIIQSIQLGKDEIPFKLVLAGEKKQARLKCDRQTDPFSFTFAIQEGVKCTSCGAILPNQQFWGDKHYPKCKSFIPRFEEMKPARVYIQFEFNNASHWIPTMREDGNIRLFSNREFPLPEAAMELVGNSKEMVQLLWRRELALYRHAAGEEEANMAHGYQPA
ncbi:hypothetical protein SY88_21570 [Clostridiales bacterium PH28_bin88]|nr:hypothetical protein SY88_21570 [Clostridiales bacterium PH28_bin88]